MYLIGSADPQLAYIPYWLVNLCTTSLAPTAVSLFGSKAKEIKNTPHAERLHVSKKTFYDQVRARLEEGIRRGAEVGVCITRLCLFWVSLLCVFSLFSAWLTCSSTLVGRTMRCMPTSTTITRIRQAPSPPRTTTTAARSARATNGVAARHAAHHTCSSTSIRKPPERRAVVA